MLKVSGHFLIVCGKMLQERDELKKELFTLQPEFRGEMEGPGQFLTHRLQPLKDAQSERSTRAKAQIRAAAIRFLA